MAGREGFEPPEARTSTVFKTAAFDHSAISRNLKQTYPNIHHSTLITSTLTKSQTFGGDTQIRTGESRLCRPMPYHLAMSPQSGLSGGARDRT